jgi:hypothetical protein
MTDFIFYGLNRATLESIMTESDFSINESWWDQVEIVNRKEDFLSNGNISKKVKRQHQSHYELVMLRTPKTI